MSSPNSQQVETLDQTGSYVCAQGVLTKCHFLSFRNPSTFPRYRCPTSAKKNKHAVIVSGGIVLPLPRAAFVRECVAHYEPMLPRPTHEQYTAITKALLEQYLSLRDRGTLYWVSKAWDIFQLSTQVTIVGGSMYRS